MRKMTITEGLTELKLLDSRISKAINKKFIWSAKKADMTLTETDIRLQILVRHSRLAVYGR